MKSTIVAWSFDRLEKFSWSTQNREQTLIPRFKQVYAPSEVSRPSPQRKTSRGRQEHAAKHNGRACIQAHVDEPPRLRPNQASKWRATRRTKQL